MRRSRWMRSATRRGRNRIGGVIGGRGKFRSLCASEELRDIPTDHIGARLSFPRYPRSAADLLHGHAHPMAQRSTSLGT
jgi:hypothetical protein